MGVLDKLESKVVGKAQNNVKARVAAFTAFPNDAKNTVMSGASELRSMKPVQAVLTVADNAGHGLIKLVKEQVAITRRWFPY